MNTNYNPWKELYGQGNWKWVIPIQIGFVLMMILLFNLEM